MDDRQAEAVGLLGIVAGQDVEPGGQPGSWRIARKVTPDRVISVVDPDTRHMHKSVSSYRDGYKAHLAVEPETGLITATALTPANAADGPTGVELLDGEPEGLEVLADSAYGGGRTRTALRTAGHQQTIKPIPLRAAVPGGYTKDDFAIDLQTRTVTCPAGHTVPVTPKGQAAFKQRCASCPLRQRCTTATGGRTVQVYPWEAELQAARRQATDPWFQASYRRWRPRSNAPSRGWSQVATGGSAIAALDATSTGSRYGSPRSTCAAWSTLGLAATPLGGCSAHKGDRGPGGSNEGRLYGLSHPAWPAYTLNTGASDRTSPGPTTRVYDADRHPESELLSRLLAGPPLYSRLGTPNIRPMFVCHCRAVTDGEIRQAITAGACDLDEVGRRCGAGVTCGGCCPLIQELLAEQARAEPAAVA